MTKIISFLVMVFSLSTSVLSQSNFIGTERREQVADSGVWYIDAFYKADGAFSACQMSATYVDGTSIIFDLDGNLNWILLLQRQQGYPSNTVSQINLYVDKKFQFGGQAQAVGQLLSIPIPLSEKLIVAMRWGKQLDVETSFGRFQFKLTGTATAIKLLVQCVADKAKSKQPPVASVPSAVPVPQDKLLKFAAKALENAGIANYRFIQEPQTALRNAVSWELEDRALGSLVIYSAGQQTTLDNVAASEMSTIAQTCKGELAQGKKAARYWKGSEILRMFSSCRSGDIAVFQGTHSLIKLPNGDILSYWYLVTNLSVNAPPPDPGTIDRTEEALLVTEMER